VWHNQFSETGCYCRDNCYSRLRLRKEPVEHIHAVHSPRKSTARDSWELDIPEPTGWNILQKWLAMKPYMSHKVQVITRVDEASRFTFCGWCQNWIEEGAALLSHVVFNYEAIFHLSDYVNCFLCSVQQDLWFIFLCWNCNLNLLLGCALEMIYASTNWQFQRISDISRWDIILLSQCINKIPKWEPAKMMDWWWRAKGMACRITRSDNYTATLKIKFCSIQWKLVSGVL
jgi:hypothetical protein